MGTSPCTPKLYLKNEFQIRIRGRLFSAGSETAKDNGDLGVCESTRDADTGRDRKGSDRGECDLSNIDDSSQDLYRNEPIDESFGFDILSGWSPKHGEKARLRCDCVCLVFQELSRKRTA